MSTAAIVGAGPIETGKVAGRRILRFETVDQALEEAERLAAAERASRLTQLGNWTLGQALGHVAAWAEFGYTQFPLKTPLIIRLILRLQKKKFLYGQMPAGVRIPGVKGGTLATELMPTDEGLARLRTVFERLKREVPTAPSPVFGKLTHEESIAINLRHAELHLSFFVPG
jgi:uncharacterized protein DUF1569